MYRGPDDTTLDDIDEQGPLMAYLGRYVTGWDKLTPRQRDSVRAQVHKWLVGLYEAEHGNGPTVEEGYYGDLDKVGPPPKEVVTIPR